VTYLTLGAAVLVRRRAGHLHWPLAHRGFHLALVTSDNLIFFSV
jgi:hypothetical protein